MSQTITILPQRKRYLPRLLFCLAMAMLCIVAIVSMQSLTYGIFRLGALVMGVVGPPVFLLLGFYFFRQVSSQPPQLVADDREVMLNWGLFYKAQFSWNEVSELGLVQVAGKKYILFKLEDADTVMGRASGMELRSQKAYYRRFGTPAVFDAALVDKDPVEFLKELQPLFFKGKKG